MNTAATLTAILVLACHTHAYGQRVTLRYQGEHPLVAAAQADRIRRQNSRESIALRQIRYEARRDLSQQWRADRHARVVEQVDKFHEAARVRNQQARDNRNRFIDNGMIREESGALLWPSLLAHNHETLARHVSIAYREAMTAGLGGIGSTSFSVLRQDMRKLHSRISSDAITRRITATEMG